MTSDNPDAQSSSPASNRDDRTAEFVSEANFFFEQSLDLLSVLGLDGYFRRVNPAFTRVLGYSEVEFLNRPFLDFVHPEDHARTLAEMEKSITGLPTLHFENRYRARNGSYHWLSWTASPLLEKGLIYCVARDVTQQKQADLDRQTLEAALHQANQALEQRVTERTAQLERAIAALRESEERNYRAMEVAQMFSFEWEPGTDIVKRSAHCGPILGLTGAEAVEDTGANFFQRIHPQDRNCFVAELQTLTPENSTYKITYRVVRLDGQIVVLEESGRALFDSQRQLIRLIGMTADVTNRQRLETQLADSRIALQRQLTEIETIYQSAPIGLSFLDTDLRFVRINQRLAEINGFSIDEHIGKTVRELLPQLADTAEQLLQQVLDTGTPLLNVEVRGETPAQPGVQRIWLENFLPLKDGDTSGGQSQRVIGINIVCEEVTERIRVEEALRQSETQFRNMADHAPVMIWMTDANGYCTYLSQSWYNFTGQTEATGLGVGWMEAVHPEDEAMARATFLQANTCHEPFQLEYRLRRQDGEYRWAIDAASPWFGVDGHYQGYIGSVIDITDRKQAEEDLRQSEERYRTLFETMEDGFCVVEVLLDQTLTPIDYRFLEVNPAFERQTGLRQAVGKTALELIPDLEKFWIETYGRVALTGEPIRFENGSEVMQRWYDVYTFRIGQPEERKVAILFKEISERKAIEVQRENLLLQEQAAREAAEQANRMKDEFLAVLSHELRTPLNPILGWAKLLQAPQLNPEKLQMGLTTIERNAKQQVQLIDDLLDISRIIRGKIALNFTMVNLVEPIEAALETVRLAAEAKGIQLQVVLEPAVGQVRGDASRLQQVVWNLLSNAVKFTPSGGRVTVRLEQVPGATPMPAAYAQISVSDNGKGIQPDFLPHVFELFRQQDSSTTRSFGGLGLGLAIARQVVEAHGGTITVASTGEGQGASFTVQLPLISSPMASPSDAREFHPLNLENLRVMVVDDDVDSLELIKVLLEQEEAIVQVVSSAPAALRLLSQAQFDLLISDIGMPEMDGYLFLRQVRALPPQYNRNIPAIALTAYAGETNRRQVLAAGFQAHLAKPIDPKHLLTEIATLVTS